MAVTDERCECLWLHPLLREIHDRAENRAEVFRADLKRTVGIDREAERAAHRLVARLEEAHDVPRREHIWVERSNELLPFVIHYA